MASMYSRRLSLLACAISAALPAIAVADKAEITLPAIEVIEVRGAEEEHLRNYDRSKIGSSGQALLHFGQVPVTNRSAKN